jgi:HrpA-like RNA helicase
VPLEEFERKKAVIEPLKDKLNELLWQRHEFDIQLTDFSSRLNAQNVAGKTRSELMRIGIDFEREIDKFSRALPMYARKSEIVEVVQREQVSVILGETGSGKSTQILQYLFSAGLHDDGRSIVCTQPRKVAAISLARRVAEEMRTAVGELVGYKVGMQAEQSSRTRLLYVTDHVLLNDSLKDPLFAAYSCIVIDEAHERSIYTDLLLGFVKRALVRRPDLRVVIMSATINPDLFVSYFAQRSGPDAGSTFHSPPVLRISGRAFPVDTRIRGRRQ